MPYFGNNFPKETLPLFFSNAFYVALEGCKQKDTAIHHFRHSLFFCIQLSRKFPKLYCACRNIVFKENFQANYSLITIKHVFCFVALEDADRKIPDISYFLPQPYQLYTNLRSKSKINQHIGWYFRHGYFLHWRHAYFLTEFRTAICNPLWLRDLFSHTK